MLIMYSGGHFFKNHIVTLPLEGHKNLLIQDQYKIHNIKYVNPWPTHKMLPDSYKKIK